MKRLLFPAVLLAFVLLALFYNLQVPLGEGPDEAGHFRYVLFLSREGRLPVQYADGSSDVPGEGHQPPLAYLLALPAVAWLPPEQREVQLRADPNFVWSGGDGPAAFMRGSQEYWPWPAPVLSWRLVRAVSALLAALTVLCVWGTARTLFGPTVALPSALLVALNPQFLFTSALVTNDALLTTLSAALLWLAVAVAGARAARPQQLRRASRPRSQVGLGPWALAAGGGLLLGLALITKLSALLLAPLLAWALWRVAAGGRRALAGYAALAAGIVLLLAGWWYARNWLLYGDPLGLAVFRAEFTTAAFNWRDPAAWLAAGRQLLCSFWACFGWLSVAPPPVVTWFYAGLTALGLFGWLRRPALWSDLRPAQPAFALLLLPLLALIWITAFAFTAGLVAWQGRLIFPALPAIAILLARGLLAWFATERLMRPVIAASAAILLALALYLPPAVIAPAYEWRTLPPDAARQRITEPLQVRYRRSWERGLELHGWRQAGAFAPGAVFRPVFYWHPLEPIPDDWTVFVHVVDGAGRIVAESNQRPQSGAMPTPQWTPGDWIEDPHRIWLPPDLPAGRYDLIVGLYLPQDDDERLTAWTFGDDFVDDQARIATLELER
jgi:hypothetical protein